MRSPGAVVLPDPVAIAARLHVRHPFWMIEVPLDRLANGGIERLCGAPTQFTLDLACIDRVAAIMARPIGYVGDEPGIASGRVRSQFIQQSTDAADDLDVGLLVPAADVVSLANLAPRPALSRMALQWSLT